jgi:arsenic resistance protein ArsH
VLYGSLRATSVSRVLAEYAAGLLPQFDAEAQLFDPRELPLQGTTADHPAAQELRRLCVWSEAQLWCSPETHGSLTGVFKNQLDWLPLELDGVATTRNKPVALMQVTGGGQSFNALNTMRLIARHFGMIAVPSQFTLPHAHRELDASGMPRDPEHRTRVHDMVRELCHFARLVRAAS